MMFVISGCGGGGGCSTRATGIDSISTCCSGGSSFTGIIINNVFPLAIVVMVMVILLLSPRSMVDECRICNGQQHNVREWRGKTVVDQHTGGG